MNCPQVYSSRSNYRLLAAVFFSLLLLPSFAVSEQQPFQLWLEALRAESLGNGISDASVNIAFAEIKQPAKRIIENDRAQPEAVQSYTSYLNARVTPWRKDTGQGLMLEHRRLLTAIEQDFGVQARFLVAVWGIETNFGTYALRESIFNVLATLAYDGRRSEFFRAQFMAALSLLDAKFPPHQYLKSSWAGAMGQPQFMPQSYLSLAVDFDGNGEKDIWNSEADVLASIANYFKSSDWDNTQTWGRRVVLPKGGEISLAADQGSGLTPDRHCAKYKSLGAWRDLQEWQAMGVRRLDGSDLPTRSLPAALVMADAGDNEAYIVYRNFCSIMGYNPSFKYALSVGLLSDLLKNVE